MKLSTKILLAILFFLAPFIVIDVCWLASFGAFDLISFYKDETFWVSSIMYWILVYWIPLWAICES